MTDTKAQKDSFFDWLRKKLGYDTKFQMFKSFAVDIGILVLLYYFGVQIGQLSLECPANTYTPIENFTQQFLNSSINLTNITRG